MPSAAESPVCFAPAALVVLPLVPFVWAAGAYGLRRFSVADRMAASDDRQLARALVIYVAAAVIIGNVAVQAVRSPRAGTLARRDGGSSNQVGRMPFRGVTLKVADEPNGLSTDARDVLPAREEGGCDWARHRAG